LRFFTNNFIAAGNIDDKMAKKVEKQQLRAERKALRKRQKLQHAENDSEVFGLDATEKPAKTIIATTLFTTTVVRRYHRIYKQYKISILN
jgi:hypothetical protein